MPEKTINVSLPLDPDWSTFAKRLAWAREQAGLSLGQAARLLGVHSSFVRLVEDDLQLRYWGDFPAEAATVYDVDRTWLTTGEAPKHTKDMLASVIPQMTAQGVPEDAQRHIYNFLCSRGAHKAHITCVVSETSDRVGEVGHE